MKHLSLFAGVLGMALVAGGSFAIAQPDVHVDHRTHGPQVGPPPDRGHRDDRTVVVPPADHRDDHRDDHHDDHRGGPMDHRDDHRDDRHDDHGVVIGVPGVGGIHAGVDVQVVTPPGPPPPQGDFHRVDRVDRPHREWRVDRPVVSGSWQPQHRAGETVIIRGQNFGADTAVMWGGAPVPGARVTPEGIEFIVPAGHADGAIVLHGGGLDRDLPVGQITVGTADPEIVIRQQDDDRRARAEAWWHDRERTQAHDRAARDAAFQQEEAQLDASREQRREARIAELHAKWHADFLASPDTEAELTLHEQRSADLDRMARLAEQVGDAKLAVRIHVDTDRENARHDQRMGTLQASFGGH